MTEDPTPQDIAEACRGTLPSYACSVISNLDLESALGFAFSALLDKGEDPEAFLIKKGILLRE